MSPDVNKLSLEGTVIDPLNVSHMYVTLNNHLQHRQKCYTSGHLTKHEKIISYVKYMDTITKIVISVGICSKILHNGPAKLRQLISFEKLPINIPSSKNYSVATPLYTIPHNTCRVGPSSATTEQDSRNLSLLADCGCHLSQSLDAIGPHQLFFITVFDFLTLRS